MEVTLHLPDNFKSLAPIAQLDAVMSALTTVLLKVASDDAARDAPTAAAALAVAAPFGVDNYGRPFKSQAEADDWKARSDARERNLDGSDARQQAEPQSTQVDVRPMALDPDLQFVLAQLGREGKAVEAFRTYGPTKQLHELSNLMTAGGIVEDPARPGYIVPPPSFPQLAELTVVRAKQLAGLE